MTVVAYRSGILAADTMAIHNDHIKILNSPKVMKRRGLLMATAGELCPPNPLIAKWFFSVDGDEKRPAYHGMKFDLIVITPKGVIQLWDQRGEPEILNVPFYAIGSGKEYAMGAMEMGASAIEAVKVAIKWCPTVGGHVISRRLGK